MAQVIAPEIDAFLQAVAAQVHADADNFVGRKDIVGTGSPDAPGVAQQFLDMHNRMLVLVGPPDIGKTALISRLARDYEARQQPYLAHFCGLNDGDSPYLFCAALAQQLLTQLGGDYKLPQIGSGPVTVNVNVGQAAGSSTIIGVQAKELNIGSLPPRELFRQLVREPLRAYDKQHGDARKNTPLVVLIDALDRAWEWDSGQGDNIVSLLADVQDLPPWVNFICAARSGSALQALRTIAGVRVYELDPKSDANLADIKTFLRDRFVDQLPADQRARLVDTLRRADFAAADDAGLLDAFVNRAGDKKVSQGNFRFVRQYVRAWMAALQTDAGQQRVDVELTNLVHFGVDGSLAEAMNLTYADIYRQLQRTLDENTADADEPVLAALAIAFSPLNLALLACITGKDKSAIGDSLKRLAPVLEPPSDGDEQQRTYAFYYQGFAEYIRLQLPLGGRDWDVQAAQALEQSDDDDPVLHDYSAHFRRPHLLRGLNLAAALGGAAPAMPDSSALAGAQLDGVIDQAQRLRALAVRTLAPARSDDVESWLEALNGLKIEDVVTQARLMRELATQALEPAQPDDTGSWMAALTCLKVAEQVLLSSRSLIHLRARPWLDAEPPQISPELIELERTYIALGDAYATIARRMDAGGRPPGGQGIVGWVQGMIDAVVRLPLKVYLVLVLILHGVRRLPIPGALQNLGRAQDWTVARLYVLSVSAYRRAEARARARGADDVADDAAEQLAALYTLMGAYAAAASSYEMLLARPTALERPWRQAVRRLALGEVLVLRRQSDQAVAVLTSALVMFEEQQAPIPRARALTALASAQHAQARVADDRRDHALAEQLDQHALDDWRVALSAWNDVTAIQDDDRSGVDPDLAKSYIAHQLWSASRDRRVGIEQQRAARALLDDQTMIAERHFPLRFEHPLLRLFRVASALFLPLYVLGSLLLAVQLPSSVQVRTRIELIFQPPLLDLASYPNELIGGSTPLNALGLDALRELADRSAALRVQTSAPALDPLAITWIVLIAIVIYLAFYTVIGLTIIFQATPARFQSYRPGRLILKQDRLTRQGPTDHGTLLEAGRWIWEDALWTWARLRRAIAGAKGDPPLLTRARSVRADVDLDLTRLDSIVTVDRRILGYLLRGFSFTMLLPRDQPAAGAKGGSEETQPLQTTPAAQENGELVLNKPIVIPGSTIHYEELCDELEQRPRVPRRCFNAEIVWSVWGVIFALTLLYTIMLVVLLPQAPALFSLRLPLLGYSLSNLYVLATPGLLLPLLWWLVARPLGASSAHSAAGLPLALVTVLGLVLTAGLLVGWINLTAIGLKPDLVTPLLALGFLGPLAYYAPPRPLLRLPVPGRATVIEQPLRDAHPSRLRYEPLLRLGLAILAAVGLALVARHIGTTLLWYNALVRGNMFVERALADPRCAGGCAALDQAIASYGDVICQRPGDSDGYAFRGFAYLSEGDYQHASTDFRAALQAGQSGGAGPNCEPSAPSPPTVRQQASLYANLGSVYTLMARDLLDRQHPLEDAEFYYDMALGNYDWALHLVDTHPGLVVGTLDLYHDAVTRLRELESGAAPESAPPAGRRLSCSVMAQTLLGAPNRQALDPLAAHSSALSADKASFALQIADTCYSRGLARLQALPGLPSAQRDTTRQGAWDDLVAAVVEYTAVADISGAQQDRELARRGVAATWLELSNFDPKFIPFGAPDPHTSLMQAMAAYQAMEKERPPNASAYAGQAWTALRLGSWESARAPLAQAMAIDPHNPTYPALQGLGAWLESTQYNVARKSIPSPEYTAAISDALGFYTQVITLNQGDLARAYATRSLLFYSLRNSPRGGAYDDKDFAARLHQAIADVDQALLAADRAGVPQEDQVGYRYWRGRLRFALGLTWQEKSRGLHDWSEIVPLYSGAFDDFTGAVAIDHSPDRRRVYEQSWIPWLRIVLTNSVHLQLAQAAAQQGDFARARTELTLIDPDPAHLARWDVLAAPRPDYAFLRGLVGLGSEVVVDFPDPLAAQRVTAAQASYTQAISETENPNVVPQRNASYPDDSRPAIYQAALADLDGLLAHPPPRWSAAAHDAALEIRAEIQKRLAAASGKT